MVGRYEKWLREIDGDGVDGWENMVFIVGGGCLWKSEYETREHVINKVNSTPMCPSPRAVDIMRVFSTCCI